MPRLAPEPPERKQARISCESDHGLLSYRSMFTVPFILAGKPAFPRVPWPGMALLLSLFLSAPVWPAPLSDAYRWAAKHRLVAHANGSVGNRCCTNSLEAFTASYQVGHRVFEMDFNLSADGHLVAVHDWSHATLSSLGLPLGSVDASPLTRARFASSRIHGTLTPLTIESVMRLLSRYPDAWLITDTKVASGPEIATAFRSLVRTAHRVDPRVLDRVIPQVYNPSMYQTIRSIHPFHSWIYTLYMSRDSDEEVVAFVRNSGVRAVTMSMQRANPHILATLKDLGIFTYVHTINDLDIYRRLRVIHVHGIYTDRLSPRSAP